MRKMVFIVFLLSFTSVWAISFTLAKCVGVYTGSFVYQCMFQWSTSFLFSLLVSHFLVKNYVKILWE